jgi:Predicted membrane protein
VSLSALLMAIVILIKQNRQSKVEALHAHLDLQVNMLTEQKVSKLIELLEELRRDLPMVRDRRDMAAEALQEPADTHEMLHALKEGRTEGTAGEG